MQRLWESTASGIFKCWAIELGLASMECEEEFEAWRHQNPLLVSAEIAHHKRSAMVKLRQVQDFVPCTLRCDKPIHIHQKSKSYGLYIQDEVQTWFQKANPNNIWNLQTNRKPTMNPYTVAHPYIHDEQKKKRRWWLQKILAKELWLPILMMAQHIAWTATK